MNRNNYSISTCTCKYCKSVMFVPRKKCRNREKNHVKDIWCYKCKKVVKMNELRDADFHKNMCGSLV